jgi:hypothetical protein
MGNKFSSALAYFRSLSYSKKITVLSVLVLVIALPAILLTVSQQENISSKADTNTVIEAESGTVTGNATIKDSTFASGGKYILLNAMTTPQPPTPTTFQPPTPRPTVWPPTPTWHPNATPTPRPTTTPYPTPRPRPTSTPTPTSRPGNGNGH